MIADGQWVVPDVTSYSEYRGIRVGCRNFVAREFYTAVGAATSCSPEIAEDLFSRRSLRRRARSSRSMSAISKPVPAPARHASAPARESDAGLEPIFIETSVPGCKMLFADRNSSAQAEPADLQAIGILADGSDCGDWLRQAHARIPRAGGNISAFGSGSSGARDRSAALNPLRGRNSCAQFESIFMRDCTAARRSSEGYVQWNMWRLFRDASQQTSTASCAFNLPSASTAFSRMNGPPERAMSPSARRSIAGMQLASSLRPDFVDGERQQNRIEQVKQIDSAGFRARRAAHCQQAHHAVLRMPRPFGQRSGTQRSMAEGSRRLNKPTVSAASLAEPARRVSRRLAARSSPTARSQVHQALHLHAIAGPVETRRTNFPRSCAALAAAALPDPSSTRSPRSTSSRNSGTRFSRPIFGTQCLPEYRSLVFHRVERIERLKHRQGILVSRQLPAPDAQTRR